MKRRDVLWGAFATLGTPLKLSAQAVAREAAPLLRPEQARADAKLMRRALEEAHPGLLRYQSQAQLDAAFARLDGALAQPVKAITFYGHISALLASIRCDHTKAEYSAAITRWRRETPTHLPLRFKLFEGRMFVHASDPDQAALVRGTEVLSINRRSVAELLQRLAPLVSIDGFTDASRPSKLEADADLMGSGFDQFHPAVYGFSNEWRLQVRNATGGASREVALRPITFDAWTRLPWPAVPYRSEFYNSVTFRTLPGKAALLRVDTFVNYRNPVDPMLYYGAYFKALREAQVEHLVIDLRHNGGGSSDATVALAAHLLAAPFVWNKPVVSKALRFGDWTSQVQTWGDPKELFEPDTRLYRERADGMFERITDASTELQNPIDVSPHAFRGRVSVLTGPVNGSGATMLIAKLKDSGRVTLVGEATGGSAEGPTAGFLFFLKLPESGLVVRVANLWNRMAIERFTPGMGVAPDIVVPATLDDWLAGNDRALSTALAATPAR
jgi:Peptidase family S41